MCDKEIIMEVFICVEGVCLSFWCIFLVYKIGLFFFFVYIVIVVIM